LQRRYKVSSYFTYRIYEDETLPNEKVMLTLYSALWLCLSDAHFDSPLYRSLHSSTSLKQALYVSLNRTAESLYICEISGSHGGKYEDDSLLEYSAV
jgi:hypothetical protein